MSDPYKYHSVQLFRMEFQIVFQLCKQEFAERQQWANHRGGNSFCLLNNSPKLLVNLLNLLKFIFQSTLLP